MSLRERVRLLRKELCDEVIVELDRLEAEIASIRAELAAERSANAANIACAKNLGAELAATKKKCREADERAFKRTNDTNNLREEIKDRDEYVLSLHEQLDALRAAARQDAEEKARLKEALEPFAKLNVTRFMTDGIRYSFRVDAAWIRGARAALACRPQENSHGS